MAAAAATAHQTGPSSGTSAARARSRTCENAGSVTDRSAWPTRVMGHVEMFAAST